MANSVYLEPSIDTQFQSMSPSERQVVLDALDRLEDNPFAGSEPVEGYNLRVARAGNKLIYFRFVPEKNAVLVSSILADLEAIPA